MANAQKVPFQELIKQSDVPILIDFWAPWCGPCRAMAPVLQQIADQYRGQLKVLKINVDDNPVIANHYRIQSIPTLMLFDQGKVVMQQAGAVPYDALVARLKPFLNAAA